jgi:hypothetical protein
VDEIHRFNKAQQDAFYPMWRGGSSGQGSTEKPFFELLPLAFPDKVLVLKPWMNQVGKDYPQGHGIRKEDWENTDLFEPEPWS